MNDHLTDPQMILYQARALPSAEMKAALEHLTQCPACRQHSHKRFQAANAFQASAITLSPVLQFRHEHLDSEQVTGFVNESLDKEEQEIAQAHLQSCQACRSEVQHQLAFQAELQTELRHRYGPKPAPKQAGQWKSFWRVWQWKPVLTATFVAVCGLTTIMVFLHQGQKPTTSHIALASPAATSSVSTPSPSAAPKTTPNATISMPEDNVIASLRDGAGMIAVTRTGELEGIPSVTDELRDDIVAAMRTGKLDKPAILHDLANDGETVRGTGNSSSQHLTPVGITVLSNRPTLRWQSVEKAIGYEIEIADGRGNEIARSERLSSSTKQWQPTQALSRGTMYTWTVRAIHEDTITALPPTGRFKVLGTSDAIELTRMQKQAPSHLVLGMFYARVGMLPEAHQEFKALAKQNPNSAVARKLLNTVQAWR